MTVHIKGKSSGCVTQILLNSLHIVTGFERNNGIRVAQIVKSHGRHPQFTDHQLECPVQSLGCDACNLQMKLDNHFTHFVFWILHELDMIEP